MELHLIGLLLKNREILTLSYVVQPVVRQRRVRNSVGNDSKSRRKLDGFESEGCRNSCSETRKYNSLSTVETFHLAGTWFQRPGIISLWHQKRLRWLETSESYSNPLLVNFEVENANSNMSESVGKCKSEISTSCSIKHVVFPRRWPRKIRHRVTRCLHTHTHNKHKPHRTSCKHAKTANTLVANGRMVPKISKKPTTSFPTSELHDFPLLMVSSD